MTGRMILVCDDEPHIVHVVLTKLRNGGYQVITASDGEEAFELAMEHRPALIITDYQMPMLSGLELCTKVRSEPTLCGIPAIMLSARGFQLDAEHIAHTNIKKVLPKPFSPRELLNSAREVLGDRIPEPSVIGAGES